MPQKIRAPLYPPVVSSNIGRKPVGCRKPKSSDGTDPVRRFESYTSHTKYRAELLARFPIHPLVHFLSILNAPEDDRNCPATRRDEAAKCAAPYLHPRLSSLELSDPQGQKHSVDYTKLSDEELEKFEKLLAKCSTTGVIRTQKKDDD